VAEVSVWPYYSIINADNCSYSGIVQDFFDPHDKVQKHRPEFRYVEP
jgi:hypothetical protein